MRKALLVAAVVLAAAPANALVASPVMDVNSWTRSVGSAPPSANLYIMRGSAAVHVNEICGDGACVDNQGYSNLFDCRDLSEEVANIASYSKATCIPYYGKIPANR